MPFVFFNFIFRKQKPEDHLELRAFKILLFISHFYLIIYKIARFLFFDSHTLLCIWNTQWSGPYTNYNTH